MLGAAEGQEGLLVAGFEAHAAPSSFLDYPSCLVVGVGLDVVASGVERERVT